MADERDKRENENIDTVDVVENTDKNAASDAGNEDSGGSSANPQKGLESGGAPVKSSGSVNGDGTPTDASGSGNNGGEPTDKSGSGKDGGDDKDDGFEEFCAMCHRPESACGRLTHLPNNISICQDCMQKTFDGMANIGGLFPGMPSMDIDISDMFNSNGKKPNISFINMADLTGMMGNQQKVKKKKPKEEKREEPVLDIKKMPAPHRIKASLDEYVVGQDKAKKVMSVAVYNHYKRVAQKTNLVDDGVEIEKSNMLMVGPTGCGKTYLVKTLARLLNVPLAVADATSLTEAGYIGDDVESVVSKLLAAADNDVEKAEHGIVFIDEIDKLAKKKNATQRDVSGESVQQGLLRLLEGSEVEVPVGATNKNAMVPMTTVDTSNILFICGGAFPGLEDVIKERLNERAAIGFQADLKDKYDDEENIFRYVTTEDLRKFGMIPEFIGRLPILFSLDALSEEMLVRILREPKNAIIKQYQKLLAMDEVDLEFDEDALFAIAGRAKEKKVGARALRSILEELMLDIMYEIPKDENIGRVTITKAYIENTGGPIIEMRGAPMLEARN